MREVQQIADFNNGLFTIKRIGNKGFWVIKLVLSETGFKTSLITRELTDDNFKIIVKRYNNFLKK